MRIYLVQDIYQFEGGVDIAGVYANEKAAILHRDNLREKLKRENEEFSLKFLNRYNKEPPRPLHSEDRINCIEVKEHEVV